MENRNYTILIVTPIFAVLAVLFPSLLLHGQDIVSVTDSRPLAAALDRLEQISGKAINYEDPFTKI